jgi:hypothetical protein
LDWTIGLDRWIGPLDWTVGLDRWIGPLDWTVGLDRWIGFLSNLLASGSSLQIVEKGLPKRDCRKGIAEKGLPKRDCRKGIAEKEKYIPLKTNK